MQRILWRTLGRCAGAPQEPIIRMRAGDRQTVPPDRIRQIKTRRGLAVRRSSLCSPSAFQKFPQICRAAFQDFGVVFSATKHDVAVGAKDTANLSGRMAMVYVKSVCISADTMTDSAHSTLTIQQCLPFSLCQAVP
jgi:hypothetical protein